MMALEGRTDAVLLYGLNLSAVTAIVRPLLLISKAQESFFVFSDTTSWKNEKTFYSTFQRLISIHRAFISEQSGTPEATYPPPLLLTQVEEVSLLCLHPHHLLTFLFQLGTINSHNILHHLLMFKRLNSLSFVCTFYTPMM